MLDVPGYRVTVAGDALRVKLGGAVTVRESVVVELSVPEVPVMVRL